jgi:hypothetical protein
MAYSLLHEYVAINVEALQGEETSINEMQTILHTVNTSTADTLASKFVTLKIKNLVPLKMENDSEEDCKRFYQHVGA